MLHIKKILINLIFNEYQKALIFEALDTIETKKRISLGETLNEDSKEINKIKIIFYNNINLYN